MTDNTEGLPEPTAWLCELMMEDGTVRTQIVEQDPNGLRWGDIGEPSPFRSTPLYTKAYAAACMERCAAIVEAYQVPVGNSRAGEMACEWTMDALGEVRDAIRALKSQIAA